MLLHDIRTDIKNRNEKGESYRVIGCFYGISKAMAWQIEHGYKPGPKVSAILHLDPDSGLKYTRSRRERLDAIARSWGYVSWCAYETLTLRKEETKLL